MRRYRFLVLFVFILLIGSACDGEKARKQPAAGEKVYVLRGVIRGRNAQQATITIDHEAIPGFMEAMVMDYPVRGASIGKLPPDGSPITAQLHVTDSAFWVTDVQLRR